MTIRVKICGITRPEDAKAAASAGADAIGLVFYDASPRAVTVAQARAVAAALPPFVTLVGLFVDAPRRFIRDVLAQVPLDLLQFHGEESPQDCADHGRPYIKALRMSDQADVAACMARYGDARGLLLDAWQPGIPGGTGATFDWARVPRDASMPIILAGGLHAGNVAAAVRQACPYAVDVSGGVESARGIKDAAKIAAFINEVRSVEPE